MNTLFQRIAKIGKAELFGTYASGTPEWLEDRRLAVGGSDIACVMNKSPYKSALTLWAQKLQILEEDAPNLNMLLGTIIEPSIIEVYRVQHPDVTVHYPAHTWAKVTNKRFRANPDAFIENEFGDVSILEIKYTKQYWAELPEHYRLQVLWYQTITGLTNTATVAALTPMGYKEYEIEFDKAMSQRMLVEAETFLDQLDNEIEPALDGSESSFDTVRKLSSEIDETGEVALDAENWDRLISAMDMQDFWGQQVNLRKAEILRMMNGAKYGYVNGEHVVSLRQRGAGSPYLHINER